MASIDRTAYPRFRGPFTNAELEADFALSDGDKTFVRQHARGAIGRLSLAVSLKTRQWLGHFPALTDVPDQIRIHLADNWASENNLLGEQHIRYGRYGGIAYHHISATYIALFSNFIACGVWEAVYILDGLLQNRSEFEVDTVHADTHGQSEPVFGLAYLFGIELLPRMRTWNDAALYRPDAASKYDHIDALFTKAVDWPLIEAHWQDMMQVVLSIQAGKVLPSMLLRKLGEVIGKSHQPRILARLNFGVKE